MSETPSWPLQLAYRVLGWRLGPEREQWVRADLASPGWVARQLAAVLVAFLPPALAFLLFAGGDPFRLLFPLVLALLISLFRRQSLRERALRLQGLSPDGVLPGVAWWSQPRVRLRYNVIGATGTVLGVLGALLLLTLSSRH